MSLKGKGFNAGISYSIALMVACVEIHQRFYEITDEWKVWDFLPKSDSLSCLLEQKIKGDLFTLCFKLNHSAFIKK